MIVSAEAGASPAIASSVAATNFALVSEQPEPDLLIVMLKQLWKGKWILLGGLLAGLLVAVAYLHFAKPKYTAYLLIVPTEQGSVAISRNLTGLASLAGLNIPRGQQSLFPFALATFTSRDVANVVAKDDKLMRALFPKDWDDSSGMWREPRGFVTDIKHFVRANLLANDRPWQKPGAAELQRFLQDELSVNEDQKTQIATVAVSLKDPQAAKDLVSSVFLATDDNLRRRMELRTSAYVAYISRKLQEVTLTEHRETLAASLAEQERTLMMAQSGQPFAADPLGNVTVSDRPTSPVPLVVLAIGTVVGLILAILYVLLPILLPQRPARVGDHPGIAA